MLDLPLYKVNQQFTKTENKKKMRVKILAINKIKEAYEVEILINWEKRSSFRLHRILNNMMIEKNKRKEQREINKKRKEEKEKKEKAFYKRELELKEIKENFNFKDWDYFTHQNFTYLITTTDKLNESFGDKSLCALIMRGETVAKSYELWPYHVLTEQVKEKIIAGAIQAIKNNS